MISGAKDLEFGMGLFFVSLFGIGSIGVVLVSIRTCWAGLDNSVEVMGWILGFWVLRVLMLTK